MAKDLKLASLQSGEELWQMPLQKSYKDGYQVSYRRYEKYWTKSGGSITAALFLEEFLIAI